LTHSDWRVSDCLPPASFLHFTSLSLLTFVDGGI
jgi:hypothetical protein